MLLGWLVLAGLSSAEVLSGRWINEGHPVQANIKANTDTLLYVQVLWRHGDRTPADFIPTDTKNGPDSYPEGIGELTLRGMAQQYRLGKWLRQRYDDFLGPHFDRNEIYVRSSDYNRTLMSAQANMAGLFPPTEKERIERDLHWQPVPVHTVPREIDVQLYEQIECPTAEKELDRIFEKFPRALEIAKREKEFLEFLSNKSGIVPLALKDVWRIHDPLFVESCHNSSHQWPSWVNQSIFDHLVTVSDDVSRLYFHTDLLRRLRGGPLVQEVLERFTEKAEGGLEKSKIYAYSAHDTTLSAILATFGIFPVRFPLYATAVILEMHRVDDQLQILLFHKNDTDVDVVYRNQIENCRSPCTLDTLKAAMKPFAPDDYRKECGLDRDNTWKLLAAVVVLGATTIIFGSILAVDVYLRYGRRRRGAEESLLENDESA